MVLLFFAPAGRRLEREGPMGRSRIMVCGLLGVLLVMGCGMRRDLASNTEGNQFSEGGAAPGGAFDEPGEEGESEPSGEAEDPARCDGDLDGVISEACGGGDCDDSNPLIYPGAAEQCNFTDDDCDGEINEDEYCGIYVHTRDQLLLIEPFVGEVLEEGDVPDLLDFDTAPDGTLYGITFSSLVVFDEETRQWEVVGTFGAMDGSTNGFAIQTAGSGYATSGNSQTTMFQICFSEHKGPYSVGSFCSVFV